MGDQNQFSSGTFLFTDLKGITRFAQDGAASTF
jgi:hypothetical protein